MGNADSPPGFGSDAPDVLNDGAAGAAMSLVPSVSLGGRTLGILGLGRIGEAIAKRPQAFGMKIAFHDRNRKDMPYAYCADAASLANDRTVLLIATPGGAETKNLVNAKVLDALGPQGFVVNIARGSVINELVLIKYLRENRIVGAGLDVIVKEPQAPTEFFAL